MSTTRERYLEWKNRSSLPQLPIEIWAHIFSYVEVCDLLSIRLVSRLFYLCVNQHTRFWSSIIFDIDQCSTYLNNSKTFRHIRTSNLDLLTKSNRYSHCQIYVRPQPLINSINKRRKRRLLMLDNNNDQTKTQTSYLRCSSVHFDSLRSFDQVQLEILLRQHVRRLEFSYECLSHEPSLTFLLKLERLKYLKISFVHNITQLDPYAMMLINTFHAIMVVIFKLKGLKSLVLHNLHLNQTLPDDTYAIECLRSIWLENCVNIHFLLSAINKHLLKNVMLRHSTCDHVSLINFLNDCNMLRYLDLSSLETVKSSNHVNVQLCVPPKLKTCSLNSSLLINSIILPHAASLRSLELIDVNIDVLLRILKTFQSVKLLCLFYTTTNPSIPSIIQCLQKRNYSKLLIHFHLQSIDDHQSVPKNVSIMSLKRSLSCFCYKNLIE